MKVALLKSWVFTIHLRTKIQIICSNINYLKLLKLLLFLEMMQDYGSTAGDWFEADPGLNTTGDNADSVYCTPRLLIQHVE